eukprot:COSAG04_NODE_1383_length_6988_cov_36.194658_5_plen_66_part_01
MGGLTLAISGSSARHAAAKAASWACGSPSPPGSESGGVEPAAAAAGAGGVAAGGGGASAALGVLAA